MLDEIELKRLEDHFDRIYKKKDECVTDMKTVTDNQTQTLIKIAKIETSQTFNNWLTGLVAGGIIALVIKIFLAGGV